MAKQSTAAAVGEADQPKPTVVQELDAKQGAIPDAPNAEPEPPPMTWLQALNAGDDKAVKKDIIRRLEAIVKKHTKLSNYEVLFLFDDDPIETFHADRLYSAASKLKGKKKNILLIIHSGGGRIEPAYLISKTLKRIADSKFAVAVPRRAKSAATLLALGADEIHMGMMSQLGPIDPQLSGLPVLALANAVNHVADLACKFPGAADMLTKYLSDQVPIRILGYYERVSESAAQYAERLLNGKKLPNGKTAAELGLHLVQHYKDHSFVIDAEEAIMLLGSKLVKEQTPEYGLADDVYNFLEFVELVLDVHDKRFWLIGDLSDDDNLAIRKKPSK